MDAVIAIEEIAAVCPRSADVVQAGNFGAIRVLAQFATPEQKERYLAPLLDGDGSDLRRDDRARRRLGGDRADDDGDARRRRLPDQRRQDLHDARTARVVFLVYVRFGPGVDGIGSVLIERGRRGLQLRCAGQASSAARTGIRSASTTSTCPPENVLLGPGGFKKQMGGFNVERIGNTARSLALGRYSYELAREHAHDAQAVRPPAVPSSRACSGSSRT